MKKYNEYPGFLEVVKLASCGSTNDYLRENYRRYERDFPILVTASRQSAGRGRAGRTWDSPAGMGLYSSFGFFLPVGVSLNLLPLAAGISVVEALAGISGVRGFGLKWPNDILYSGRKICGILVDNMVQKERIFCITGIGINLNQQAVDFPRELRDRAISLKTITGKTYEIEAVNKALSHIFFSWVEKLKSGGNKEIVEAAGRLSEFLKRRPIAFHRGDKITEGVFKGLNHDGGLLLAAPNGDKKIYYSGEIVTKLRLLRREELERKHRQGYTEKPVEKGEFSDFEDEQLWGD